MVRLCGEARPAAPRTKREVVMVVKENVNPSYLTWGDLPPNVKHLYLFLLREYMEGMSYIPNDNEGVGSMTAYLKEIITAHNELMYKKFEFLSFLGPNSDGVVSK